VKYTVTLPSAPATNARLAFWYKTQCPAGSSGKLSATVSAGGKVVDTPLSVCATAGWTYATITNLTAQLGAAVTIQFSAQQGPPVTGTVDLWVDDVSLIVEGT
jgi:hypothetical protein